MFIYIKRKTDWTDQIQHFWGNSNNVIGKVEV